MRARGAEWSVHASGGHNYSQPPYKWYARHGVAVCCYLPSLNLLPGAKKPRKRHFGYDHLYYDHLYVVLSPEWGISARQARGKLLYIYIYIYIYVCIYIYIPST